MPAIKPIHEQRSPKMRTAGVRREPELSMMACGALLAEGARFNESLAALGGGIFMPKGVFRYKSHEAANQHQLACLVSGMASLAAGRLNQEQPA